MFLPALRAAQQLVSGTSGVSYLSLSAPVWQKIASVRAIADGPLYAPSRARSFTPSKLAGGGPLARPWLSSDSNPALHERLYGVCHEIREAVGDALVAPLFLHTGAKAALTAVV